MENPGAAGAWGEGRADTRARLLAESEALLRSRGYAGFSYADLASAVGIRKASIHHHFPAKEDLGAALICSYRERYDLALRAISAKTQSGAERIKAYAGLYLEGFNENKGCLCGVMACERDILPSRLRAGITQFFEEHLRWLETVLEAGIENGTFRKGLDCAAAAKLILSTLQGTLILGRISSQKRCYEAAVEILLESLMLKCIR